MPDLRPAAEYLRMSTDHQRYSLLNQAEEIGAYARAHGYEVVRSYEDAGKSGLSTHGRDGLKRLLADVLSGNAPFRTVLVLDVSRWGRFQDPDEAAHYEFICTEAGCEVVYCAELFEAGPTGSILKQLKRIMAAEYSRQLSERSRFGKRSKARRGLLVGGAPPFGFARQAVNSDGSDGPVLGPGEMRSRLDQDVRYAWGPSDEVALVRRIFRTYVREDVGAEALAARLNAAGRLRRGEPWTRGRILSVLKCELTAGWMLFGKSAASLDGPPKPLPRTEWERLRVCPPMVGPALFRAAQERRKRSTQRQRTDAEMIADLRRLLEQHGHLSAPILHKDRSTLGVTAYVHRFGTLAEAYRRAGYGPRSNLPVRNRRGEVLSREDVLQGLRTLYGERGRISLDLVDADPRLPGRAQLKRLFGSLPQAYAQAGLPLRHALQRVSSKAVEPGRAHV